MIHSLPHHQGMSDISLDVGYTPLSPDCVSARDVYEDVLAAVMTASVSTTLSAYAQNPKLVGRPLMSTESCGFSFSVGHLRCYLTLSEIGRPCSGPMGF